MRSADSGDVRASDAEIARERIVRLFRFVEALHNRRNPAQRQVSDHEWTLNFSDIPENAAISLVTTAQIASETDADEFADSVLLRCGRPDLTRPPIPPEALTPWIGREWDDCKSKPSPIESRNITDDSGETHIVRFDEDSVRIDALANYRLRWNEWAANERIALAAGELFEKLYRLHGILERDGERFELGLADGILVWGRADGGIRHPLLFRSARLEFRPDIPEFRIVDAGTATEFYSALFRSMDDVDGTRIGSLRNDAEALGLHPLGGPDVDGFLRGVVTLLSARGDFVGGNPVGPERPDPQIGRAPLFLLRRRTAGLANAIAASIDAAQNAELLSRSLCNIVGKPLLESEAAPENDLSGTGKSDIFDLGEDSEVLFTKPANAEQIEIARSLKRNDCVIVQGPPGTGKTHTIANLLGHLLAEGKSVLVVSHTTKALKVLRAKVVTELQPLCVSVLDSIEDDAALKSSIEGIIARLGSSDAALLERDISRLKGERNRLLTEVKQLRASVLNARLDEIRQVVVAGDGTDAIEAAKAVASGKGVHDWIPSPVLLGSALPLSIGELIELYKTNQSVTPGDEQALTTALPSLDDVPAPDDFKRLISERDALLDAGREHRPDLWQRDDPEADLSESLRVVNTALSMLVDWPEWTTRLVTAGFDQLTIPTMWNSLIAEIDAVKAIAASFADMIASHQPRIATIGDPDRTETVYRELATDVNRTGKPPGFLTLQVRRDWKTAIEAASIGGNSKPRLPEHFEALANAATLARARDALKRRWFAQVTSIGGPALAESEQEPESICFRYRPLIVSALAWYSVTWTQAVAELKKVGFRWDICKSEADTRLADFDEVDRLRKIGVEILPACFAAEHARRRWDAVQAQLREAEKKASRWIEGPVTAALRVALHNKLPDSYAEAYAEAHRLQSITQQVSLRNNLLLRLEHAAPAWAANIRTRTGIHSVEVPPGDVAKAWRWRQFEDELERRNRVSLPEVVTRLEATRVRLQQTTAKLVDAQAWRAQISRTTPAQRQALMGFAQAKARIGRGTGKRAATFAKLARESLTVAQSAVPVWIMPVVKAAEMFDPRSTSFDVVIVDEASQSDVTGLLAFLLGKQIVVVGDDEQVSPSAVGEEIAEAQHLIDEFLQGIPNAQLFDGKQSLYDIARRAFGGATTLLEHFRCVPDIIRFSNHLSYDGAIRPLREASPSLPQPAVVPHRVASTGADRNNVNEDEARAVAAIVVACSEQPEYKGKTFGIISLVGEFQARRIEQLLRNLLSPDEIEARRLLSGNASQFQGDERHIIFLSMVQTGAGRPLPTLRERTAKQRFNVAASRAQDQMWVIYSLDPALELQSDDLRRRLIDHALDPNALARNEAAAMKRAESPFEKEVIQRLSAAGFYLISQYSVGAYRIDLVVEGDDGTRLAVECDGDRYHRPEELERDIERQAILERVGWTFERIRGSFFYRDPDAAMRSVFDRLRSMGIGPRQTNSERPRDIAELHARVRARASALLDDEETFASVAADLNSARRFGRRAR